VGKVVKKKSCGQWFTKSKRGKKKRPVSGAEQQREGESADQCGLNLLSRILGGFHVKGKKEKGKRREKEESGLQLPT